MRRVLRFTTEKKTAEKIGTNRPAGIEVGQRIDNWIASENSCRKLINTPLQVVIEVVDGRSPEFPSELEGMLSSQPREIIKDLIAAARAAARYTESDRPKILDSSEVKLGQTQLARAEIQAMRGRVPVCIQRTERCAVSAVAEADFIDPRRA